VTVSLKGLAKAFASVRQFGIGHVDATLVSKPRTGLYKPIGIFVCRAKARDAYCAPRSFLPLPFEAALKRKDSGATVFFAPQRKSCA